MHYQKSVRDFQGFGNVFHVIVLISFQAKTTYCIFAGGLHDFAEPDADSLPLVTLVRTQSILQDGNNFWENLFSQFSHQISKSTSRNLKKESKHWQKYFYSNRAHLKNDTNNFYFVYFYALKEKYRSLIRTGGSQKAQQQSEERWQDLTKSSGGVGNYDLPDVEGSLSNDQLSV